MKHMCKQLFAFLLSTGLILSSFSLSAYAADDVKTVEKTFTTTEKEDDGKTQFEESIEENGVTYELNDVTVEVTNEETIAGNYLSYTSEVFSDAAENHVPDDIIQKNGVTYKLKDYTLVQKTKESETKHVESPVTYENIEGGATIPQTSDIEVENTSTGQKFTENMPLISQTSSDETWNGDFSFEITISDYDADTFNLNGTIIHKGDSLLIYAKDFLKYLNLPADKYKIDKIDWSGDEYTKNGVVCRDAIASGSKLTHNVTAIYGGDVTIPGFEGQAYECTYVDESKPDSIVYTMKGTATYKAIEMAEETETDNQSTGLGKLFSNLSNWIKENQAASFGLGTLFLLAAIVIIIAVIIKKKKKETINDTKITNL